MVLGLEEDRGQGEHLGPDAGAVGFDDRPRRTSALVAVRPRKVEVMLLERHLHEELLPVPKALQLEELLFDEPVKRLHVRIRVRPPWRYVGVLGPAELPHRVDEAEAASCALLPTELSPAVRLHHYIASDFLGHRFGVEEGVQRRSEAC